MGYFLISSESGSCLSFLTVKGGLLLSGTGSWRRSSTGGSVRDTFGGVFLGKPV